MAQLPNPWISNSVDGSPPSPAEPAAALSRTSVLDAQTGAAANISKSALASEMTADTAAAPDLTDPPVAAAVLFAEPPSNEGRSEGTPASAPTKNPDVGVLGTEHIHEIFAGARKLYPPIDFEEDEVPLFIRDGDHLRRWEA